MDEIRVLVNGALGKMGQTVMAGLAQQPGMKVVGGVDIAAVRDKVSVPGAGIEVPISKRVDGILAQVSPTVLVDFSRADATLQAVRLCAERGVSFVVGTTGLPPDTIEALQALADKHKVGGVVAPNFALGAVLMMHLARLAAPYFDYAEIIEMHHETKIDAPSGTSAASARMMAQARGKPFKRNVPEKIAVEGTRGGEVEGVTIHSVRLPGAMAHQEVIFGIAGQTLRIRHDQIDRAGFVPGIAMAVKHAVASKGFVYGLDRLMGL